MKCPNCHSEVESIPLGPYQIEHLCLVCGWVQSMDGKDGSKTNPSTQHADKPQRPSDPEQWEIEQEKEKKIMRAHDSAVERSGT